MKINGETIAIALGMLWGVIPLSYWLTGSPNPIYVVILIFYTTTILLGHISSIPRSAVTIIGISCFFFATSALNELGGTISIQAYATLGLFTINLSMMLTIIQPEKTKDFLRVFFKTTSLCAMLHIVLVMAGRIDDHYGRYLFLGNNHPNLGGEIYAVASFAGSFACKRKSMIVFSAPLVLSAYFMQTRTGIAVVGLTLLLKLFVIGEREVNLKSLAIGFVSLTIIMLIAASIPSLREWFLTKVVLADDANRGLSTGLVTGRDHRWSTALDDFLLSPFIGNGLSWYSFGRPGAHSPIFYSLAYFGIFGFIFWAIIFSRAALLLRRNQAAFFLILPNFLMVVINDRFLNSNAFPLLFYFLIFHLSRPDVPQIETLTTVRARQSFSPNEDRLDTPRQP